MWACIRLAQYCRHHVHITYCLTYSEQINKFHPVAGHEGPEANQRCSSTLFLSLALDGGGWSMSWPWPLYSWERDMVPIVQEAGWALAICTRAENLVPPLGFNLQTIQPVASHYTDYTLFRAVIINTIFAAINMWSVHSITTITVMVIMLIITSCLEFFSAMATVNNLPLFWNSGFQFFLQHDIYLSVLPYARGRFIPRAYCWFCDDVSLWRNLYDRILKLCPRLSLRLSAILHLWAKLKISAMKNGHTAVSIVSV